MNNFAESIQSLVGNSKNCKCIYMYLIYIYILYVYFVYVIGSKDWQSSPDVVDSILHMTEFESLSSDPPKVMHHSYLQS